jgi:hypothetical protein
MTEGSGLPHLFRGAFATRGAAVDSKGSGAPTTGLLLATLALALTAFLLLAAAPAGAAIQRPFQENFGRGEEQTFPGPRALAFDQANEDLLVYSTLNFAGSINRFNKDGTPAAFSALGGNVIDGKKGPGGKPCAEEAASCDATPQEGLEQGNPTETNVVVDESGGATDGDIYVNQSGAALFDVFASTGRYLGQVTKGGTSNFTELCGIAVGPDGTVFASDFLGGIFAYTPTGNPPVNSDNSANITAVPAPCTEAAGAGPTEGSLFVTEFEGPISKVDIESESVDYVVGPGTTETVDPVTGHVFIVNGSEVGEFDASGATTAQKVTEAQGSGRFTGAAVNSAEDLLYVSNEETGKVEVFGPPPPVPVLVTGAVTSLTGTSATLNATVNPRESEVESCVFEWGETAAPYEHTTPCAESGSEIGEGNAPVPVHADIGGLNGGTLYHYRVVASNSVGSSEGDDKTFGTPAPPQILEETALSVSRTEASLLAKINPTRFPTTFRVEYGRAGQPYEHSTVERGVGSDGTVHSLNIELEGLTPGIAYHWRVVASNEDPAFPGTGVTEGAERFFHTYAGLAFNTDCPNQAFRTGPSASLPDCRAYEMVSPIDKNGGDIASFLGVDGDPRASYNQSSITGEKITYSSGTPFGDTVAGRNSNQYLATRTSSGWQTHSINAPGGRILEEPFNLTYPLETAFTLFNPDLSDGWVQDARTPPLTSNAAQSVPNFYRRDNAAGTYTALTEEPLTVPRELEYQFRVRGTSSDYSDLLFDTRAPMTPDAFQTTAAVEQTYLSADDGLHLVSVMPDGTAFTNQSSGGEYQNFFRVQSRPGALSEDGSRAFWTAAHDFAGGSIYLRENPAEPQSAEALGSATGTGDLTSGSDEITGVNTSGGAFAVGQTLIANARETAGGGGPNQFSFGTTITAIGANTLTVSGTTGSDLSGVELHAYSECTEPAKACTIPVSEPVPGGTDAQFNYASGDGSMALFTVAGSLYEFDTASGTSSLVAGESLGVAGGSADGSRVYFVSNEDLATGASAGEPNLYLYEGGNETFIATLAPRDLGGGTEQEFFGRGITSVTGQGKLRGSRTSPDGRSFLFMSASRALSERVAGYDNTDAKVEKPDREVYIYQVGSGLSCVSCNPSGTRPVGELMEEAFIQPGHPKTTMRAAAWIPGWEHDLLAQRVLMDDGNRVFFNSFDALVPGDTNGTQDVYEWERPGTGDCSDTSASFSEQDDGCVNLISNGQSPQVSEFVDAPPDGKDVFFTTGSSLVPQDPGLIDIYDARIDGGFAPTPTPAAACEGEACQGTPSPPNDATPASSGYNGPGNVKPPAQNKKQKRNKQKKSEKKKQHKKKQKRAANSNRRTHR